MPNSLFFRLLTSPIPAKGDDLRQAIAALNQGQPAQDVYQTDPADFSAITGSPFAYWASEVIINIFRVLPTLEGKKGHVALGLSTKHDQRFVRVFWEVSPDSLGYDKKWSNYANGSLGSPFYYDFSTIVLREDNFAELRKYLIEKFPYLKGNPDWILHSENDYISPCITWPLRARRFSPQALPYGYVFSARSYALVLDDHKEVGIPLLAFMSSLAVNKLLNLKTGVFGGPEFVTSVVRGLPFPESKWDEARDELSSLGLHAYELARLPYLGIETAHVFCLPTLISSIETTLQICLQGIAKSENQRQAKLATIQDEIDARVAELYGAPELGQTSAEQTGLNEIYSDDDESLEEEGDDDAIENIIDPASLVADLLMWCVGVAFGRWDVRKALDPSLLPELPGPFDPLPVCSPGMLIGTDGLPMRPEELPADYPLPIAWDGFLVDDPDHPRDIVSAVERTLALIWRGRLEQIEREACEILGVPDLRHWFRDPKGFFAYHIKRYSKSRRKAPIYWLLQSAKRNYAIWLYYPRLSPSSLYHAGREYADAKLKLELGRLEDWQSSLATAGGSVRKIQERKIAGQEALVDELRAFIKALDAAALLELEPDLNDGVLLNIAPLHELVPWKEASHAWDELIRGKYEWSSIGKQLRQKGLVKSTDKMKEAK